MDEFSGIPTHTLDGFTFVLEDGSATDLSNIDEPGWNQRIYALGMVCVRSLEAQEEDDAEEETEEPSAPADRLFAKVGPITKWFSGDGVTEKCGRVYNSVQTFGERNLTAKTDTYISARTRRGISSSFRPFDINGNTQSSGFPAVWRKPSPRQSFCDPRRS